MVRILSIDWDYYMAATADERARLFPDGLDAVSSDIAKIIWSSYYANPHIADTLNAISVKPEYQAVCGYLAQIPAPKSILIAQSHMHMYDFVCSNVPKGIKTEIVNIDFHHDCYPVASGGGISLAKTSETGVNVNCGNWLRVLLAERPEITAYWVSQKDSEAAEQKRLKLMTHRQALSQNYDMVFICRSDTWSCPHLDSKFTALCGTLLGRGFTASVEKGILDSRITDVLGFADQEKEFWK